MQRSHLWPMLLIAASAAAAQDDKEATDLLEEPVTDEVAAPEAPRPPLGYLSDPNEAPKDFWDALVSGKIHFDDRLRFEFAETTGKKPSYAFTNRLRLGYETKAFYGFSGLAEFENVATPNSGLYSVPPADQGDPDRTTIADPRGTEINRIWGRYKTDGIGDTEIGLDAKGGRQRIIFDDQRFVGNVGWRQFEQTYDSARLTTDFGVERLTLDYTYVWGVQRIFGPNGPNWDSDSHFLRAQYQAIPELTLIPFAYLLDFRDDSPLDSVNSYGIRITGDIGRNVGDPSDTYFDYEATYAYQNDAGSNPVDFEAHFLALQARMTRKGLGAATLGYQLLGSDDGNFGFRFPLGTNHKFQGFADQFLTTPAEGLQDLYIAGKIDLPHDVTTSIIYHQFWTDEGGKDLGFEIDLVATVKFTNFWSALTKFAYFDGHNGQPDTVKFWIQTDIKF
ncbi:MAG: alginate export family protein [Planctomycetota bacterium]